jgi:myo-inositol-1(or 4)-monophosphatase
MSNRSPLLNVIFQSLNKVTRNLLRDFGEIENLQVSPNSLEQFVSKTEKKISSSLLNDLTKSRPEWGIKLDNDSDYVKDKHYWIVDSLNGRFNFLHGLPHFAISVAVELNNEILCTVILDPVRDEFYFAEKGKGSFQNDRRIRVSKRNKLKSCIFSIFDENTLIDKKSMINYFEKINLLSSQTSSVTRSFGSSALSFAWLASGKIDCLFVNKLNKNQIACGELLIKEAGGYLTNLKYINAYDAQNNLLIGANPILHKEILKKINHKN